MSPEEADGMMIHVPAWHREEDRIVRDLQPGNFMACVELVNRIAAVAEQEDHHPDLLIHGYRNLRITLWTHAIGGLSQNDFILAAKIDLLLEETT